MNRGTKQWLCIAVLGCFWLGGADHIFSALSLTSSSNNISIPIATTDYNFVTGAAQVIRDSAHTMTVFADKSSWTVTVRAQTSTFSFAPSSGDANPNKPANDLALRVPVLSPTWIPISTSNQIVGTGSASNSNQTGSIDYRLNSNLSNNPPGNYSLSLIYTITSP